MNTSRSSNPPGMWTGFYSTLSGPKTFTPRMGLVHGMELTIDDDTKYMTQGEAVAAARAAAWERHEEWQREAPEKTIEQFICDQVLAHLDARDQEGAA